MRPSRPSTVAWITVAVLSGALAFGSTMLHASVRVTDGVPALGVETGAIFFDVSFGVSYLDGPVLLAAQSDGQGAVWTDDEIIVTVTRPDETTATFSYDYSTACARTQPTAPQDVSHLFRPGSNLVRVQLRDRCGVSASAGPYWLVGVDPPPRWRAIWDLAPTTFRDVAREAKSVVTAEVMAVDPASDIIVPSPSRANGEDRIPTERVTLRVLETHKGRARDTITVFHTGAGLDYVEGDPPYRVGEIYLLALANMRRQPGILRVLCPEARYRTLNEDTVRVLPMQTEGLAANLWHARATDVIPQLTGRAR